MRLPRFAVLAACFLATLFTHASAETSGLTPGTRAPEFTAYTGDGKATKLSDFQGKYVLVDFWATWCGPCRAAMPHVEATHRKLQDQGLVVLGVCVADEQKGFATWLAKPKVPTTYTLLYDRAGRGDSPILNGYHLSSIPSFFLIGPDGTVRYYGSGADDETEAGLHEALKSSGFKL